MASLTFAPLGTVISGTHNTREVAEAMVLALVSYARTDSDTERATAAKLCAAEVMDILYSPESNESDEQKLSELVNESLPIHFSKYALPFARFGAHEGDGADIGFWVCNDSLEEAMRTGVVHESQTLVNAKKSVVQYLLQTSAGGIQKLVAVPSGMTVWEA